jgi:hypothetical protein
MLQWERMAAYFLIGGGVASYVTHTHGSTVPGEGESSLRQIYFMRDHFVDERLKRGSRLQGSWVVAQDRSSHKTLRAESSTDDDIRYKSNAIIQNNHDIDISFRSRKE